MYTKYEYSGVLGSWWNTYSVTQLSCFGLSFSAVTQNVTKSGNCKLLQCLLLVCQLLFCITLVTDSVCARIKLSGFSSLVMLLHPTFSINISTRKVVCHFQTRLCLHEYHWIDISSIFFKLCAWNRVTSIRSTPFDEIVMATRCNQNYHTTTI